MTGKTDTEANTAHDPRFQKALERPIDASPTRSYLEIRAPRATATLTKGPRAFAIVLPGDELDSARA
jgi:hypothetical protein